MAQVHIYVGNGILEQSSHSFLCVQVKYRTVSPFFVEFIQISDWYIDRLDDSLYAIYTKK